MWFVKRTRRIPFLTLKRSKFSNGLFRVRLGIEFPVKQGINREIFYFLRRNIEETERNSTFTMTSCKNNRELYRDIRVSKLPIMILRTPDLERFSRLAMATSDWPAKCSSRHTTPRMRFFNWAGGKSEMLDSSLSGFRIIVPLCEL